MEKKNYLPKHAFCTMSYMFSFGFTARRRATLNSCLVDNDWPTDFNWKMKGPFCLRFRFHLQYLSSVKQAWLFYCCHTFHSHWNLSLVWACELTPKWVACPSYLGPKKTRQGKMVNTQKWIRYVFSRNDCRTRTNFLSTWASSFWLRDLMWWYKNMVRISELSHCCELLPIWGGSDKAMMRKAGSILWIPLKTSGLEAWRSRAQLIRGGGGLGHSHIGPPDFQPRAA